jgi:ATP/maltotriose-dependent transcriptional regulator MalT
MINNLSITSAHTVAQVEVLTYRRQFDEAIALASSVLVSSNNPSPLFVALGRAMLGNLHVAKGDRVKAQPLFVQAEKKLKSIRAGGDNGFLLIRWFK